MPTSHAEQRAEIQVPDKLWAQRRLLQGVIVAIADMHTKEASQDMVG